MAGPSGQTDKLHLPFPVPDDTVNVPRDVEALADALDLLIPGTGPDASVINNLPVLDVGSVGQIRAGHQLTAADFTDMGLAAPAGLWNLSDLTDASGNNRNLQNKGAVPFGTGINGLAATAAVFSGSSAQVLYVSDTGANDALRIRNGSWGCWFRTAKRGVSGVTVSKWGVGQGAWLMSVNTNNVAQAQATIDGSAALVIPGTTDVADDRWHFGVCTYDGTALRLYVDGALEGQVLISGLLFSGSGPLNVGGWAGDGATAANSASWGRVDEAFVTPDVLSEDQIRRLYAVKIPHGYGSPPSQIFINVRRFRKGAVLAAGDFAAAPQRLYNLRGTGPTFLSDDGTQGIPLNVVSGAEVMAGPDGGAQGSSQHGGVSGNLSATDAGLPAGVASRSYGCWFKSNGTGSGGNMIAWGTASTGDARLLIDSGGVLGAWSAGDVATPAGMRPADGQWHHVAVTEENAPADGIKRKLYLDGRVVGISLVLNPIVLAGATSFRIGSNSVGTGIWTGQLARAFVVPGILTAVQIRELFAKGSQDLGLSPKNAGDHVEAIDNSGIFFIGDTLESQHRVQLGAAK